MAVSSRGWVGRGLHLATVQRVCRLLIVRRPFPLLLTDWSLALGPGHWLPQMGSNENERGMDIVV